MTDDRVVVGRLGKPHGVRGEVMLRTERDDLSLFAPGTEFATPSGTLTVGGVRRHHGNLIARFEGVADRDAAEMLRGIELSVERSDVRLDDDEWWTTDLVGCRIVDVNGTERGTVTAVEDGVAHARIVVDSGHGSVEVPFVDELVPEVDAEARVVVVDLPDGWWADAD
ncbi:MAG: 16S rRNA processing protein RimM [Acidimicrobiia bacterium]|nr:16S rRNA processing protein RimM [Acidimicrobiia bacterium]